MKQEVLIKEFLLPLWQEKDIQVIEAYVSETADIQTTLIAGFGPKPLKYYAESLFKAFAVFEWFIDHAMRRESQVIYQWRVSAVHTGRLLNIEPSHRMIEFSGMVLSKIEEGLITQYHCFTNLPQILAPHLLHQITPHMNFQGSHQPAPLYKLNDNPCLCTFNDPDQELFFDKEYLINLVREATGKRLTIREVECLWFWLKGFSIKNTAKILGGLSSRTIQTFRENIKRKLDVDTYQELFNVIQTSGILPFFIEKIFPKENP